MYPIKTPKKLIEVALPLDAINAEAALRKRKAPGGYPTTLHKWWAQRPVAAARAVIFAQMVNDPGYQQGGGFKYGVNKEKAAAERERLFKIIEELVLWENTNNEEVLERARAEIWKSWRETCELNKSHPQAAELFNPEKLPAFHDPFAGSGAIPLEALRLGLESYASDLNPVAVTINKAMIEIPPKFAGRAPVGPEIAFDKGSKKRATRDAFEDWTGAKGLAEDVRRYGAWMREQAQERIGHLYPQIEVTAEMVAERPDLAQYQGEKLTVIAWLWARTVKSPNPAFSHAEVPLASTFILSSKAGKESYVEPVIEGDNYRFEVRVGTPPASAKGGTTAGKRSAFICLLSGAPVDYNYIRSEGQAGRMGQRLMAVVAEGARGRVYLSPTQCQVDVAHSAQPEWAPEMDLPNNPRDFKTPNYGLGKFGDLFTPRQLVALTTFSDLVQEAIARVREDALATGMPDDGLGLDQCGIGATAYAQAVGIYLACAISRLADYGCSLATWRPKDNAMRSGMPKQALQMSWDFAEGSPLGQSSSGFIECTNVVAKVLETALNCYFKGEAFQCSATEVERFGALCDVLISTDPPYYDNISYADLSDFLYTWIRRCVKPIFPGLYATLAVPKAEELVATPYRHGGKEKAEAFFLGGMKEAIKSLSLRAHPGFPVTVYYAFKQAETKEESGTSSTGWETFLSAVIGGGFSITGTWPVRTEGDNRQVGTGNNALASSIVLVCRPRAADAPTVSRREFIRELNATLPDALIDMTRGGINSPVAPVDLSQAIIGPGMEVFSKHSAVLEADGSPMSVRSALQLINRFVGEDDFDHDTQFCLSWFEQHGWAEGKYGDADVLARAKGTSVNGLVDAGVVDSSSGSLRLLKWAEIPRDWSPESDSRLPVWEALHQLIRALNQDGETTAGQMLARMPDKTAGLTALTYRLYTLCERQGWANEARAYNELQGAWLGIEQASQEAGHIGSQSAMDI
jgi:Adenine-specific DNA methylase containing a Zn-ribbon